MIFARRAVVTVVLAAWASGCDFQRVADRKFGDQHFKTAIALIELHRVRFGEYPGTLADLQYLGEWDQLALSSVRYQRLPEGYALDIERGWVAEPTLAYPAEFWRGLGLRESNVKPSKSAA